MGIWFTKPEPQFEQRMPWVTSEIIHDDWERSSHGAGTGVQSPFKGTNV